MHTMALLQAISPTKASCTVLVEVCHFFFSVTGLALKPTSMYSGENI